MDFTFNFGMGHDELPTQNKVVNSCKNIRDCGPAGYFALPRGKASHIRQ
jgi:hypothetical protein